MVPDKLNPAKDIAFFRRQLKSHLFLTFVISLNLSPSTHPVPLIPLPFPMSSSTYHPPPTSPFSIFFAKRNEHAVFCMEPDCALQVVIDIDTDIANRAVKLPRVPSDTILW